MNKYSEGPIKETFECIKEENNLIINRKTAIEYLDAFAKQFLAFRILRKAQI